MYKCVNANILPRNSQLLQGLLFFLVAVVVMLTLISVWILCWFRLICYLLDWPYHPFQTTWIYGETPSWKIWIFDVSAALMVHFNSILQTDAYSWLHNWCQHFNVNQFDRLQFYQKMLMLDFLVFFFSLQVVELQMKFCTWCQIKKTSGWR